MTTPDLVAPSSIVRWIVFAWLVYVLLWIFPLSGGLATEIFAAPLFGLVLIVAFLVTVAVTVRGFLQMLHSATAPRWVLISTMLSAMGIVAQVCLLTTALPALFNFF
jgi:hypothetical protein